MCAQLALQQRRDGVDVARVALVLHLEHLRQHGRQPDTPGTVRGHDRPQVGSEPDRRKSVLAQVSKR